MAEFVYFLLMGEFVLVGGIFVHGQQTSFHYNWIELLHGGVWLGGG